MRPAGLLYIASRIKHPDPPEDTYNHWYNTKLIPSMLAAAKNSGGPALVLRYKNNDVSPDKFPDLALLPLDDLAALDSDAWTSLRLRPADESVECDVRQYELMQRFEGKPRSPKSKDGTGNWLMVDRARHETGRGTCIVAAANTPGVSDAEFDEWYRKQHLDMLSMVRGYRRSTRYKLVPTANERITPGGEDIPRYLALHEFDNADFDMEQLRMCARTEWSKRVVGTYRQMWRDNWRLVHEAGDTSRRL
ncbi:hypothetical protein H2199_007341 [Coniosporium tulheliwenetii]|uniref:Uncharacterized protein n=1 Tax=Coniosporium tulheliwenetii TaxID=3383036 RepID=A0ACC2YRB5_9PEZI|nr:hypothetical protein H2199_007341 [Cladosporium sp. JES 115]